ncbi:hypothetical protein GGQ68_004785 [Sagittula marina]|uniref:Uncharacterized protein n=1 Tax=Sagittula marina TaxID=943940 RepID=A0A7W6GVD4_9RHOB|nr:hypothetical protein [Sagittula marina]
MSDCSEFSDNAVLACAMMARVRFFESSAHQEYGERDKTALEGRAVLKELVEIVDYNA